MYPCQHNFLIPLSGQFPHFFQNVFFLPASDTPPDIRNDAVRTELIAAVLNFNICPCMPYRLLQPHSFIFLGRADINNRCAVQSFPLFYLRYFPFPACQIFLQDGNQILLLIIPHCQVHARVPEYLVLPGLHIAPYRHHNRFRVPFPGTVKHLPAFPVRNISHGACIYNINIRLMIKWHNFITSFTQHLLHYVHFVSVHFTAQVM